MQIEISSLMMWAGAALIVVCLVAIILRYVGNHNLYVPKRLLTDHEMAFCVKLKRAVDALGNYTVMSQVSMGAFIKPRSGLSRSSYQAAWNRISQKIVDFVLIDTKGNVVLVIELDDRTHILDKDRARDAIVAQAGYKTVRFRNGFKITTREITAQLQGAL